MVGSLAGGVVRRSSEGVRGCDEEVRGCGEGVESSTGRETCIELGMVQFGS